MDFSAVVFDTAPTGIWLKRVFLKSSRKYIVVHWFAIKMRERMQLVDGNMHFEGLINLIFFQLLNQFYFQFLNDFHSIQWFLFFFSIGMYWYLISIYFYSLLISLPQFWCFLKWRKIQEQFLLKNSIRNTNQSNTLFMFYKQHCKWGTSLSF